MRVAQVAGLIVSGIHLQEEEYLIYVKKTKVNTMRWKEFFGLQALQWSFAVMCFVR